MRTRIAVALLSVIALAIGTLVFVVTRKDEPPPTLRTQLTAAQTYKITGTEIGIMFRTDPNDWESRGGAAGYDGDSVTLSCWTTGVAVGPYQNKTWYLSTTSRGTGYLPDRFIDTAVKANEPPPGLTKCGTPNNAAPPAPAPAPKKADVKSVFFSGTDDAKGSAAESVSDLDYKLNDWSTGGKCEKGASVLKLVPDTVDTLAGWSRGRVGVVYFLAFGNKAQKDRIHRIVLFDPASKRNIEGVGIGRQRREYGCDYKFDVNKLLADWLKSDSHNQLVVIAGIRTEDKSDPNDASSKSNFYGMWKYYFAGIWNQPFADRAQVCDYNALSHEESLSDFAHIVKHPISGCPAAPAGHPLQAWHP